MQSTILWKRGKKIREFFWIDFCELENTQKIRDIKLFANEEFEVRISIFRNCTSLEFQENSNLEKPITNSEFNKKLQLLTVIKAWLPFSVPSSILIFLVSKSILSWQNLDDKLHVSCVLTKFDLKRTNTLFDYFCYKLFFPNL